MIFKPYYYFDTGCAAYLFGCGSLAKCAVVDAPLLTAAKGIRARTITRASDPAILTCAALTFYSPALARPLQSGSSSRLRCQRPVH